MARGSTKTAKEPEVEETEEAGGRGPTALHEAMAEWLNKEYADEADGITPDQVRLAQTKRREFRATDLYADVIEEMDKAKEEAEADKAKRAEERAARQAEKDAAEKEAPAEEKPARRSRKATSAKATEAGDEGPVETTRTRSRRRGTAATAPAEAAATTEEPAKPKRTRRQAAF